MEQKIPNISDNDVKRIIERDFSRSDYNVVEGILNMYKSESSRGRNRIYASILKLSDGNIELIKEYIKKANNDYRDVISLAEYPNYSEYAFDDDLPEETRKQLINDDWIQYEIWLNKL